MKEKLLKPSLVGTYTKYKYVVLANNNYRKKFLVHRLVYETFYGKIQDGYTVDHIDKNPLNNCLSNLQCITQQENIIRANNHSKRKQYSYMITNTETGEEIIFSSSTEAGEFLDLTGTHVRTTAKGKSTTNLLCGIYQVKQIPFIKNK